MTDAPALILVPATITPEMAWHLESAFANPKAPSPVHAANWQTAYSGALSASPYIDGVPVEVVERCAAELFAKRLVCHPRDFAHCPDTEKEQWRILVRTVILAAGIKVADNG